MKYEGKKYDKGDCYNDEREGFEMAMSGSRHPEEWTTGEQKWFPREYKYKRVKGRLTKFRKCVEWDWRVAQN